MAKSEGPLEMRRMAVLAAALIFALSIACTPGATKHASSPPAELRIGFGLATGTDPQFGIQQVVRNIALEALLTMGPDGRLRSSLGERWAVGADRRSYTVQLNRGVVFHDGEPLTAEIVKNILQARLPQNLGPAFQDIETIRAGAGSIEIILKRPSAFVLEGLDVTIAKPGSTAVGTGPYSVGQNADGSAELLANERYYRGAPEIKRITITPYPTVRAGWADLLRNRVDMLYDVGTDALDFVQPSKDVRVYEFDRAYADLIVLNVRRPIFRDPEVRRALTRAIDRQALVGDALRGIAAPADTPVWPKHWAFDASAPRYEYRPVPIHRFSFECLFGDPSLERLALQIQQQLAEAGVDMHPRLVTAGDLFTRAQSGDFDALLADISSGPAMIRPFLFWHSRAPFNWGGYTSPAVDAALDRIKGSLSDADYRAGVAAFHRAMVEDPPAIFLAWSQRARAVSRRFDVVQEPGRDIIATLRQWRVAAPDRYSNN